MTQLIDFLPLNIQMHESLQINGDIPVLHYPDSLIRFLTETDPAVYDTYGSLCSDHMYIKSTKSHVCLRVRKIHNLNVSSLTREVQAPQ